MIEPRSNTGGLFSHPPAIPVLSSPISVKLLPPRETRIKTTAIRTRRRTRMTTVFIGSSMPAFFFVLCKDRCVEADLL